MGVCIKGTEMPKNCDVCGFKNGCDCSAYRFVNFLSLSNDILKETRSIPSYDELLKAARAMHTWIFLHSGNEKLAYKACGLSDEMNVFLGYSGSLTLTVPDDEKE